MRLTYAMIKKLKPYFLEELPVYIENRIAEIRDDKKYENYLDQKREDYGMIITKTERPFCKSISSLVVICLTHYNFENISVRNARFLLGNPRAKYIVEKKGMKKLIEIVNKKSIKEDSTYTLGVGYFNDPNDFHSIVLANENMVLDMTANQMNRPQHNLIVKNFWLKIKDMTKHIDCIIEYSLTSNEIKPDGFIFTHPELEKIFNTILKKIAELLEIEYKPIKNIKKYHRSSKNFHVAQ